MRATMQRLRRWWSFEKPERLTAAEYRQWFQRDRLRQERALERPARKTTMGSVPTPESIQHRQEARATLARMDVDPVALRDQAERDGITITD